MNESPHIAVIDYGIGNLRSAQKALQHLGADAVLTSDPDEIASAAGVVLPGVGNIGACLAALRAHELDGPALDAVSSGRPFLGICVGMQMLFDGSEEAPDAAGLGVFPGRLHRLPAGQPVPQMQWNRLDIRPADHPIFAGLGEAPWMYFVHSYAVYGDAADSPDVIATCDYGGPVVAAVGRDNVVATQFHPEKSSSSGLALLGNFVAMVETGVLQ